MTWANRLSVLRMCLIPPFLALVVTDRPLSALAVFAAAALSDWLDGWIARRYGQRSDLGEVLDPLADKLLVASSYLALSLYQGTSLLAMPFWLTLVVLARDAMLVCGALVIRKTLGPRRFLPSKLGKATTFLQALTVLAALLGGFVPAIAAVFLPLAFLTLASTVISGLHYATQGYTMVLEGRGSDSPKDDRGG